MTLLDGSVTVVMVKIITAYLLGPQSLEHGFLLLRQPCVLEYAYATVCE